MNLNVIQFISKILTSLACFKAPRGKNQGLEPSCSLISETMGQEAERQRVAWQILSNSSSGGGHRLPTGWFIAFRMVPPATTVLASGTTSTRGSCAGPPTTPRRPWLAKVPALAPNARCGAKQCVNGYQTFFKPKPNYNSPCVNNLQTSPNFCSVYSVCSR